MTGQRGRHDLPLTQTAEHAALTAYSTNRTDDATHFVAIALDLARRGHCVVGVEAPSESLAEVRARSPRGTPVDVGRAVVRYRARDIVEAPLDSEAERQVLATLRALASGDRVDSISLRAPLSRDLASRGLVHRRTRVAVRSAVVILGALASIGVVLWRPPAGIVLFFLIWPLAMGLDAVTSRWLALTSCGRALRRDLLDNARLRDRNDLATAPPEEVRRVLTSDLPVAVAAGFGERWLRQIATRPDSWDVLPTWFRVPVAPPADQPVTTLLGEVYWGLTRTYTASSGGS